MSGGGVALFAGRSALLTAIAIAAISFLPDSFSQSMPEVRLDQETYTWTEKARIEVHSPDDAGDGSIMVSVRTENHSLDNYELDESTPGVFVGEVTLTGFAYDAYGDGTITTHPMTSGHGPRDGMLETGRDDTLTVLFEHNNVKVFDEADISWTEGIVTWEGGSCQEGADCVVTVYDPDMNIHPDRPDHLYEIFLFSDTDPVGIDVVMVETGDDTGVFSWHYTITTTENSVGQRLLASPGDSITIKYVDMTAPSPNAVGVHVDVTDTIVFGSVQNSGWSMSGIRQAIKSDNMEIDLSDVEQYFPTINKLKGTLDALGMTYTIQNVPEYKNERLVLAKRLVFETAEAAEFERIFGRDPRTFPERFKGEAVDDAYIMQRVLQKMQSCPQDAAPMYCSEEPETLALRILDKIGTHTVTESVILEQAHLQMSDAGVDFGAGSIIHAGHDGESDGMRVLISQIGSIYKGGLVPDAAAQSERSTAYVAIPQRTGVPGCETAGRCFIPQTVSVMAGDTVVWVNEDSTMHTVAGSARYGASGSTFESGVIEAGSSFGITFETPGEHGYFCTIHPWMDGVVIVSPQGLPISDGGASTDEAYFSEQLRFLNGFTLGYGFGKTWSYEYDAGFPVFYVEAHVEAGLGIGLRVPVEVRVEIFRAEPSRAAPAISHHTALTISTVDLDEDGYAQMLPQEKVFEGKEFNSYLGPAAHIKARFFGLVDFEKEKGIPHPESYDLVPPLGGERIPFTEMDVDLCDALNVCIPSEVIEVSLSAGVVGEMSGHRITVGAEPLDAQEGLREFDFTSNGQRGISDDEVVADESFVLMIQDLKYHAGLRFTPRITADIGSSYLPFYFISESLEFPGISYGDIALGTHEGTRRQYAVPEFGAAAAAVMASALSVIIFVRARRATKT